LTKQANLIFFSNEKLIKKNNSSAFQFDFKEASFFYIEHLDIPFVSKMSDEVRRAHKTLISFIETRFKTKVKKLNGNDYLSQAFEMWFTMMTEGQSDQVCQLINVREYHPDKKSTSTFGKTPFREALKALIRRTEHTLPTIGLALLEKLPISSSPSEIEKYLNLIEKTRKSFDELLGSNGILIYPSFPSEAPFHNQALFTNPLDWIVYFGILNSIGLPSTQVPLGLTSKSQMPIGVQLVANRYCDRLTLRLAELLEREYSGWIQA
jgi:fatty acid amide hydrolase 2